MFELDERCSLRSLDEPDRFQLAIEGNKLSRGASDILDDDRLRKRSEHRLHSPRLVGPDIVEVASEQLSVHRVPDREEVVRKGSTALLQRSCCGICLISCRCQLIPALPELVRPLVEEIAGRVEFVR